MISGALRPNDIENRPSYSTNKLKCFGKSVKALSRNLLLENVGQLFTKEQSLDKSLSPKGKPSAPTTPVLRPMSYFQSIRIKAPRASGVCSPFCSCACHMRQQIRTPLAFTQVIGSLRRRRRRRRRRNGREGG